MHHGYVVSHRYARFGFGQAHTTRATRLLTDGRAPLPLASRDLDSSVSGVTIPSILTTVSATKAGRKDISGSVGTAIPTPITHGGGTDTNVVFRASDPFATTDFW